MQCFDFALDREIIATFLTLYLVHALHCKNEYCNKITSNIIK